MAESKLTDFPALTEALRRYDAAFHFLDGLNETYLECANSGRIEAWAEAAQAIIRLIVSRAPAIYDNAPAADDPEKTALQLQGGSEQ